MPLFAVLLVHSPSSHLATRPGPIAARDARGRSALDQLIVELAPDVIVEGLNAMMTVGTGVAAETMRVPIPVIAIMSTRGHALARHRMQPSLSW
jgi:hypothetical protein